VRGRVEFTSLLSEQFPKRKNRSKEPSLSLFDVLDYTAVNMR
jgi:hypothetical protein